MYLVVRWLTCCSTGKCDAPGRLVINQLQWSRTCDAPGRLVINLLQWSRTCDAPGRWHDRVLAWIVEILCSVRGACYHKAMVPYCSLCSVRGACYHKAMVPYCSLCSVRGACYHCRHVTTYLISCRLSFCKKWTLSLSFYSYYCHWNEPLVYPLQPPQGAVNGL